MNTPTSSGSGRFSVSTATPLMSPSSSASRQSVGSRLSLSIQIPATPGHGRTSYQSTPHSLSLSATPLSVKLEHAPVRRSAISHTQLRRTSSVGKRPTITALSSLTLPHRDKTQNKLEAQKEEEEHKQAEIEQTSTQPVAAKTSLPVQYDPFSSFLDQQDPAAVKREALQAAMSPSTASLGFTSTLTLRRKAMIAKIRTAFTNNPIINPKHIKPSSNITQTQEHMLTKQSPRDTEPKQHEPQQHKPQSQQQAAQHRRTESSIAAFFPDTFHPHLRVLSLHPSLTVLSYPQHTLLTQQGHYPGLINLVLSGTVRMVRDGFVTVECGVGELIGADTVLFSTEEYRRWRRISRRRRLKQQTVALTLEHPHHHLPAANSQQATMERLMSIDEEQELDFLIEEQTHRRKRKLRFPQYVTVECMSVVECVVFPASILLEYMEQDRALRYHAYTWLMQKHWLQRQQFQDTQQRMQRVYGAKKAPDGEAYTDDKVLGSAGFLYNALAVPTNSAEQQLLIQARVKQNRGGLDHPLFAYPSLGHSDVENHRIKLKAEQFKNEKQRRKEMKQKQEREEKVRKVKRVIDALARNRQRKAKEAAAAATATVATRAASASVASLKLRVQEEEDEWEDDEYESDDDDEKGEGSREREDEIEEDDADTQKIKQLYELALKQPNIVRHGQINLTAAERQDLLLNSRTTTPLSVAHMHGSISMGNTPHHFGFMGVFSESLAAPHPSAEASPAMTPSVYQTRQEKEQRTPTPPSKTSPISTLTPIPEQSNLQEPTTPAPEIPPTAIPHPFIDRPASLFSATSLVSSPAASTHTESSYAHRPSTLPTTIANNTTTTQSPAFIVGSTSRLDANLSVVNYSLLKQQKQQQHQERDARHQQREEMKEQLTAFKPSLDQLGRGGTKSPRGGGGAGGAAGYMRPHTAPIGSTHQQNKREIAWAEQQHAATGSQISASLKQASQRQPERSSPSLSSIPVTASTRPVTASTASRPTTASRPSTATMANRLLNNYKWATQLATSAFDSLPSVAAVTVVQNREKRSADVREQTVNQMMQQVINPILPWTARLQLLQQAAEQRREEEEQEQQMESAERYLDRQRIEAALNAAITSTRVSTPIKPAAVDLYHIRDTKQESWHNRRPQSASAVMNAYASRFAAHLY